MIQGLSRLPSGRHNLPREFVVNSQRDRLLDSMAEACAGKRYAEVSVADVVDRAKVSRSTFYEIFPDKEACFLATYDAILGRFVAEVIRAARGPDLDWPDQIEAGVETRLAFFCGRAGIRPDVHNRHVLGGRLGPGALPVGGSHAVCVRRPRPEDCG